MVFTVGSCCC